MSILNKRYFTSEKYAFKYLESIIWPDGPVCPKCGSCTKPYDLAKTRVGLKKCRDCKKQFTVKVGTVFESSHIALHKWMQAVYLTCSSKKGISAHQLHRTLEVTYKTAWFMCHRIRVAMEEGTLPAIGGEGQAVQADETYFGKQDYGSLEGLLQVVSERGSYRAEITDPLNKKPVRCFLNEELMKAALDMFGHRVEAYGKIKYRADGAIVSINVEEFIPFPPPEKIPSFKDVQGILKD